MARPIDDNLLTDEITSRPAIWDSLSDDFHDSAKKLAAWNEVIEIFAQPDDTPTTKETLGRQLRSEWMKIRKALMMALQVQLKSDIEVLNRLSTFRRGDTRRNRLTVQALDFFINAIKKDYEPIYSPDEQRHVSTSTEADGTTNVAGTNDSPNNQSLPNDSGNSQPLGDTQIRNEDEDENGDINEIIDNALAQEEQELRGFWVNRRGEALNSFEREIIKHNVRRYFMENGLGQQNDSRRQDNPDVTLQRLRAREMHLLQIIKQQHAQRGQFTSRLVWNNLRQPHSANVHQDMSYNSMQNPGRQTGLNNTMPTRVYPSPYLRRMQPYYMRPNNLTTVPRGIRRVVPRPTPIHVSNMAPNSAPPNDMPSTNGQFNV